ncbi:alpha-L-rhamnosidase [Streptomyces sp. 7-21]|uniref:alpha-L-rhamnosidase n=1 Tax=Streptomyces sp. 7-21 TaxID=2802283 RepID=UPI00191DE417|nr:alpha-L-rhamnosidase [Streptomyces sp. 7-21]MBL1068008.1 family 78 glycoside hydrolase catalytic domain [Streptomyces sp. 7-21]
MARLTDLRTEHRQTPTGIDVTPRFSWVVTADRRGAAQLSYRVVVRAGQERLWDSGTVASDRCAEVAYEGPPLPALTRCVWTVTVTTTDGTATASSWFVTGLPSEADWAGAQWIGRAAGDGAAPLLRHAFTLPAAPERAFLAVAAGGYARVTLNGRPVADEVLSPGFTDYTRRVQYVVHDVTHLLRPGPNALGAELGRGFFGVTAPNTWDWHTAPWHGEPRLRLLLRATGRTGRATTVVSSAAWRAADGPTRYDDIYGGESYDARYERPGYGLPGYDDAGWAAADVLPAPAGRLENQRQQPVRVLGELLPEEVTEPRPGVYVLRFPRVIAGWAAVRFTAPAGHTVTLRYGERLDADGLPRYDDPHGWYDGRFQQDEVTSAGADTETRWEPRFTYKGFQYVEVSGWPGGAPPRPGDVTAKIVHADVAVTGSFTCSDPLLTRLHELTVQTVLNNLHHLPTDTPKYEKNGWTGDGMLGAELFLRNLDVHELLAKWVTDIADTRRDGGAPEVIAPHGGWHLSWDPAPVWHAAYVLIPWWLYQATGDERVLRAHLPGIEEYLRFELARFPDGIATSTLGDWVGPETGPEGGNQPEDVRVPATAYLYAMLRTAARAARAVGDGRRAAWCADQAARVRAAFRARFVDPAAGRVRGEGDRGFRQTHHLLAIAFGLLDGEECDRAAALVAEDVAARGDRLNTGALGTKYLLPVLTRHGHAARALAVARQEEYPSWGLWLRHGATSLWEHWSLGSRSRGHYFLGTVDDWLFEDVAGLAVTAPGGDRLLVRPALTGLLDAAAARVRTPRGPAAVAWRRRGGVLTLRAEVPVGATARVHLPCGDAAAVRESGVPLAAAEAVRLLPDRERGALVADVPGGTYEFTVRLP